MGSPKNTIEINGSIFTSWHFQLGFTNYPGQSQKKHTNEQRQCDYHEVVEQEIWRIFFVIFFSRFPSLSVFFILLLSFFSICSIFLIFFHFFSSFRCFFPHKWVSYLVPFSLIIHGKKIFLFEMEILFYIWQMRTDIEIQNDNVCVFLHNQLDVVATLYAVGFNLVVTLYKSICIKTHSGKIYANYL